ncbi:hypothetical protein [Streptomyces sp. NPDC051994]|uniref:hypothetical protein n=1 Tax=unclassified Streptomyces TaxID=2593676 RepID=UPI0034160865
MPQDRAGERPGSGSGGAWSGREGAEAFAAVDAATDWLLGYPFVFRALGAGSGTDRVLLDFGCGPGRVADRAARRLGVRIVGHAWPPTTIRALLERAGFTPATQHHPTPDEAEGIADPDHVRSRDWAAERRRPPLVVTVATKA